MIPTARRLTLAMLLAVTMVSCAETGTYLKDRAYDVVDVVDFKYGFGVQSLGLGAKIEVTEFLGLGAGYGISDHVREWRGRRSLASPHEFAHVLVAGFDGLVRGLGLRSHPPRHQVELLAPLVRLDDDFACREGLAKDVDAQLGPGVTAHEHVERGIVGLGPAVDRDVALGQHGHPRHAAVRREVVKMNVQQARACRIHALFQGMLDMLDIIETLRPE